MSREGHPDPLGHTENDHSTDDDDGYPDRIYLQRDESDEALDPLDTTWCVDKINDSDVEYVRALIVADKLLDDAARIIRREANLLRDGATVRGKRGRRIWPADDPGLRLDFDEMLDLARQLEARSNSSDHSDGAKEAG